MNLLTPEQHFTKALFAWCRTEHGQWCVAEPLCPTDAVNNSLPKLNQRQNINWSYPHRAGACREVSSITLAPERGLAPFLSRQPCSVPRSDINARCALALAGGEGG